MLKRKPHWKHEAATFASTRKRGRASQASAIPRSMIAHAQATTLPTLARSSTETASERRSSAGKSTK